MRACRWASVAHHHSPPSSSSFPRPRIAAAAAQGDWSLRPPRSFAARHTPRHPRQTRLPRLLSPSLAVSNLDSSATYAYCLVQIKPGKRRRRCPRPKTRSHTGHPLRPPIALKGGPIMIRSNSLSSGTKSASRSPRTSKHALTHALTAPASSPHPTACTKRTQFRYNPSSASPLQTYPTKGLAFRVSSLPPPHPTACTKRTQFRHIPSSASPLQTYADEYPNPPRNPPKTRIFTRSCIILQRRYTNSKRAAAVCSLLFFPSSLRRFR